MTLEQQVEYYRNMVKLYRFDHLTGMKQRHDFEYETTHKLGNQEFYLAMVDIIGLHKINREQGYKAGDELIKQVADDIRHSEGMWECYRIGGDEFMVLYFDKPTKYIDNATMAVVHSSGYNKLSDMVEEADRRVTEKKTKLHRRRED